MALPHALGSLTPCEAVADALYRALSGMDHNDAAMFESAFAGQDATMELRDGSGAPPFEGFSAIKANVFAFVSRLDTTHLMSNVRVHFRDEDNASLTAVAMAQHAPSGRGKEPAGPKYLAGAEYKAELVRARADGVWKMKTWAVEVTWAQGDASVMALPTC
ncbi:uncharacterized protein UV8b_05846 [Ustilaginoidea virens]|uniref:SnoaL-like domain-containing protein n=1 Tax=Ustilaginoidea virens TaxID=1159556 RepID=A0A063C798_USTVR|nr:uncharacterized protein UV8b_05846 [Ustilaginoidea virens]QUC21603.1 hypothetical protein UV8b_05846 [Ustilaginoidea virens]GAO13572.1 hypothetical protein UVI_02015550 [Ustilaginoidea virens]